jgi:chromosome segregation ATPase
MTPEEIERAIEFIVKQQESTASDLEQVGFKLKEISKRQDKFQSHLESLQQATVGLVGIVERVMTAQERTDQVVRGLAEAQARTESTVAELTGRVDTFIVTVERYISGQPPRNGKKPRPPGKKKGSR